MSNGDQCCALEICCYWKKDKATLATKIAAATGVPGESCLKFLVWMDKEDLTFAPDTFTEVIEDIVAIARKHPDPT